MELCKTVTGVAADLSQYRLVLCDVPDKPGNAAKIFKMLAENSISVDMIIQSYARHTTNTNDIAFTIDKADLDKTLKILEKVKNEMNAGNVFVDKDIAKISIVGAGMIDRPGVAADMFNALASNNINLKMISTSEIKISCLVERDNTNIAIKALCDVFDLTTDEIAEVKGDLPDTD